jgi:hypothetical protein
VTGTATANLTVNLYSGANCDTAIGVGTADGNGDFSISVSVPDDSNLTIRGKTVNAIDNASDCSNTSVTYNEDSTAPTPFSIDGTSPSSPADSMTPTIAGTTEAGTSITIHDDNSCSNQVATGTAAGDGSFSVSVNAVADDTETYWVVGTDAAGNSTSCSANSISYTNYSIAQNIGWFRGSKTTGDVDYQMNPSDPESLKWSTSEYDSNFFEHSRTTDNYQIKVLQDGDYFFSFNLPLAFPQGSYRPAIRAELLVDGAPVKGAISESTYIRDGSGHTESSAHFTVVAPNLNADQIVTVTVEATAGQASGSDYLIIGDGLGSSAKFSLFAEYIDPGSESYFYGAASGSATCADSDGDPDHTNLNLADGSGGCDLRWTSDVESTGTDFTHSTGTDPEEITINKAVDYQVYAAIPTYSANARTSPQLQVQLSTDGGTSFSTIESGLAMQGYIRAASDHYNSSINFAGLMTGVSAGDILKIRMIQNAAGGTVTLTSGKHASLFLRYIDTSTNVFFANDAEAAGFNWNTTNTIDWDTPNIIDGNYYSLNNAEQIDISQAGDYLLIYNNTFQITSSYRSNPRVKILLNGTAIEDTALKCHYIRNASGHIQSSGALVYLLRQVPANSYIEVTTAQEANSPAVNKVDDAQLILVRK